MMTMRGLRRGESNRREGKKKIKHGLMSETRRFLFWRPIDVLVYYALDALLQ